MMELNLLILLLIKHAICDLGLQSQLLWGRAYEKNNYFGGHQHYLHHSSLTFAIVLVFLDWQTALILGIADHLLHWHIDYSKHQLNKFLACDRSMKIWWWTATLDQVLHFLTYYIMVLIIC